MNDRLVPVCTPQIAAQLERPRDLVGVRLLHDDDPQAQWFRWLEIAAEKMIPTMVQHLRKGARFASSSLLLKAAIAGQGVALARERLADQALKTGALVQPFPEKVELGTAYWLVHACRDRATPTCPALQRLVEEPDLIAVGSKRGGVKEAFPLAN